MPEITASALPTVASTEATLSAINTKTAQVPVTVFYHYNQTRHNSNKSFGPGFRNKQRNKFD